jgi:hypothetical protein
VAGGSKGAAGGSCEQGASRWVWGAGGHIWVVGVGGTAGGCGEQGGSRWVAQQKGVLWCLMCLWCKAGWVPAHGFLGYETRKALLP